MTQDTKVFTGESRQAIRQAVEEGHRKVQDHFQHRLHRLTTWLGMRGSIIRVVVPLTVKLTEKEIRSLMDTWTDRQQLFEDAVKV